MRSGVGNVAVVVVVVVIVVAFVVFVVVAVVVVVVVVGQFKISFGDHLELLRAKRVNRMILIFERFGIILEIILAPCWNQS